MIQSTRSRLCASVRLVQGGSLQMEMSSRTAVLRPTFTMLAALFAGFVAAIALFTAVARATPLGSVTEFSAGLNGVEPTNIALGTNGNLWFTTEQSRAIGEITSGGAITEFSAGLTSGA